jgi:hypothetical protein
LKLSSSSSSSSSSSLVQSLVNIVTNLTKEVIDLKNDNTLLKQEMKDLHSLIEVSLRPTSQYITREQRILPLEISNKEVASIQRVPSAALPSNALPVTSIPAATTLSYRDIAAAGIPPSEHTALPDPDGFKIVTYRKKTPINTPPADIAAVNKVKPHRQPLIDVSSSLSLPVISKPERSKALFVSRFSPKVTADDVHRSLKEQLSLKRLVCTKLKTEFNSYSSFHISVTVDEFSDINNVDVWPSGCLIAPYYGKLTPDQIFTPSTPEVGAPTATTKCATNLAGNDGANGGSSTPI